MKNFGKSMLYLVAEYLPLPYTFRMYSARNKMLSMTDDLVKQRQNAEQKTFLLDMMINSLSKRQLETNTFLFFLAGHETTASALNWSIYLLAKYPDIQGRVREELDRVLGGKPVESDQLKDLLYLDMFVKEVMRYGNPVAIIVSRRTVKELYLDNYRIPKGTKIGLAIHAIHRNPEFWPNPDVFDPERFSPAKMSKQHPFAYLPFSLGKRVCIGNNFSLMEQKVFLSLLLQKFIVTDAEEKGKPFCTDPDSLTYTPEKVTVTLTKRE